MTWKDMTFCISTTCKGKRKCGRHVENNEPEPGSSVSVSDFSEGKPVIACDHLQGVKK